jgi:hypothetical protein
VTLGEPHAESAQYNAIYLHSYMVTDGLKTSTLSDAVRGGSNPSGGWSYQPNKTSRLEPTCWSLLALGHDPSHDSAVDALHRAFLNRCVRQHGYLVEDPRWPVNVAFNALVAFTWLNRRDLATDEQLRALVGWLSAAKGVQIPQTTSYRQDNSLQGWSWLDATFSWVEPTAWGSLALRKAAGAGIIAEGPALTRIAEAERLLLDRCCRDGGWNFGNSNVLNQELFPHVPTTAIALLALQRRLDEPAVTRSLAFLESHWADEPSTLALGLSLICLRAYGRPFDAVRTRLSSLAQQRVERHANPSRDQEPQNFHTLAVGLTALSLKDDDATFRI